MEKGLTVDFSDTIIACDIKVDICKQLKAFTDTKGQDHLLAFLYPGCLRWNVVNFFSSLTAGLIKTKVHIEPVCDGRKKVCSWDLGHMTKMATMPIYGENLFENLFLGNRMADNYTALGIWPYQVCSNDDPWLTYFTRRSN